MIHMWNKHLNRRTREKLAKAVVPLKGTFFYLNLNKQKHCKARHIERMLVQWGAKICAFLHERVTHMLIEKKTKYHDTFLHFCGPQNDCKSPTSAYTVYEDDR